VDINQVAKTVLSQAPTRVVTRAPTPTPITTDETEESDEMSTALFAEAITQQGEALQTMMDQMRTMLKQSNDAVKAPKTFRGEMRDAERYMQACELFFKSKSNQYGGDERKKIIYALSNMEEKAVTWATPYLKMYTNEEAEEPFESWQDFRKEFETSFGAADPAADARTGLENLQQREKSILDYSHQFSLLAARSGYSDLDLKEKFRRGLNFRVKMALATRSYDTFKELRDAALMLERNMREMGIGLNTNTTRPTYGVQRTWGGNDRWGNMRTLARDPNAMEIDATHQGPSNLRATGRFGLSNQTRCYSCQETGHISRNCPKKTCFSCGKAGHISNECRTNGGQWRPPQGYLQGGNARANIKATTQEEGGDCFTVIQQQMDTLTEGMASLMDTMEIKKKEDF
jgi:hypothetical protein